MRQCLFTICTNCDCHCHTLITGLKQLWWGADATGYYAHHMPLLYCVFSAPGIVQSFLFCAEYLYHFRFSACRINGIFLYILLAGLFSRHVLLFFTVCKPISICFLIVFQILSYYVCCFAVNRSFKWTTILVY